MNKNKNNSKNVNKQVLRKWFGAACNERRVQVPSFGPQTQDSSRRYVASVSAWAAATRFGCMIEKCFAINSTFLLSLSYEQHALRRAGVVWAAGVAKVADAAATSITKIRGLTGSRRRRCMCRRCLPIGTWSWSWARVGVGAGAGAGARAGVECAASRFHNCFLLLLWQETQCHSNAGSGGWCKLKALLRVPQSLKMMNANTARNWEMPHVIHRLNTLVEAFLISNNKTYLLNIL